MLNEYTDHWISTYTDKKFHYLNPTEEEICIEDIAHALALTCRFGGHCSKFYSVAEHSIRVSNIVPETLRLQALLHDAHEAYLHDVPRPIKEDIPQYKIIADKLQSRINNKFNCYMGNYLVKKADDKLLATEARDLMPSTTDWADLPTPLDEIIKPMSWRNAERQFLKRFKEYSNGV
jgi:hypothetical protein